MRKFTSIKSMLLLFCMMVGVSSAWADTSTLTFTEACGGSGTADDGAAWTVTSDGEESSYDNSKGIHYGTGSKAVTYIKLSTGDIPGTITKIVVNASAASGVSAAVSATVGGAAFGGDAQSVTTAAADYTFTGSASGDIVVTLTKPSSAAKALYVKSIAVTYEEVSASPLASIALSGEQKTTFYVGDTFTYEGLKVTAIYEDESTKAVSSYTVSEPDMTTLGTKTVTVSYTEGEVTKTAGYAITVIPAPVAPVGPGAGSGYVLVKDASTLAAGDKLLIVGDGVAMSTAQNTNNRGQVVVTIADDAIAEAPATAQIVTLEGEKDAWYFNVGEDAYLYAASSSKNYLWTDTKENAGDNAKATIEIDGTSGVATVKFQGTYTHNWLRYNSSSNLFACYSSGQQDIYLYRLVEAKTFDVEVSEAGWRTLVAASNATLPEGVTAYAVADVTAASVTLAEATAIKANEPYLLKADEGTYTLTISETADAPAKNLLKVSDDETANGVYVLANHGGNVGFYQWNGGVLGAGRVYLDAPAGAKSFLAFDVTTGISAVANERNTRTNAIFNLAGQRVEKAQKGLYIMNGKKVVIK